MFPQNVGPIKSPPTPSLASKFHLFFFTWFFSFPKISPGFFGKTRWTRQNKTLWSGMHFPTAKPCKTTQQWSETIQKQPLNVPKTIQTCCEIGLKMIQMAVQKVAFTFSAGCISSGKSLLAISLLIGRLQNSIHRWIQQLAWVTQTVGSNKSLHQLL